jgi:hypothetical protein
MWKRVAVVVLSAWVLFSGNAWAHAGISRLNNTLVGTGLLFFGVLSMSQDWARWVTLGLGAWLFVFTMFFKGASSATFWNDAMVALVVFVLSLLGGEGRRVLGEHRPRPANVRYERLP